jgi:hypothetical protein
MEFDEWTIIRLTGLARPLVRGLNMIRSKKAMIFGVSALALVAVLSMSMVASTALASAHNEAPKLAGSADAQSLNETNDTNETSDINDINEVNEAGEANDHNDVNEITDLDDVNAINETGEANDVSVDEAVMANQTAVALDLPPATSAVGTHQF